LDLSFDDADEMQNQIPYQQQPKPQLQRVTSRHSKISSESNPSSSNKQKQYKQQQMVYHVDHQHVNSERIGLSDEDETSKTEVISFTKEDYMLQKMLENTENSSSTSSSERMVLTKKKEELRLKKLLANGENKSSRTNSTYSLNSNTNNNNNEYVGKSRNNNNLNNNFEKQLKKEYRTNNKHIIPVAKAYDGSEDSCPEDLDTISRFPAEEELFGSIQSKEVMNKPILNQKRYTIHEDKEPEIAYCQFESEPMAYSKSNKHRQHVIGSMNDSVIYENETIFSDESESATEVDSVIEVKKKNMVSGTVGGAAVGKKNQSKSDLKKELMKRLTDEVEHLKQHILKKHLKKVIKNEQREVQEAELAKAHVSKPKKYTVLNNDYIAEGNFL
jgi:hypothetical protein